MVNCDLILPMPFVHLSSLRAKLIIFGPILLCPNRVKVSNTNLIAGSIKIHALIFMVIHMQRVDRESRPFDRVGVHRKFAVLGESLLYVH